MRLRRGDKVDAVTEFNTYAKLVAVPKKLIFTSYAFANRDVTKFKFLGDTLGQIQKPIS